MDNPFSTIACRIFIFIVFICSFLSAHPGIESGKPIYIGTSEGLGPLSTDGVLNIPIGAANVYGSKQSDLFVRTERFGSNKGLFLFPWIRNTSDGTPVLGHPVKIAHPFEKEYPPAGNVVQQADGTIHAIWLDGKFLVNTRFEKDKFIELNRIELIGLPRTPGSLAVLQANDDSIHILLEISDGTVYRPNTTGSRDKRYRPYDGAGIWHGGLPYTGLYAVTLPKFFNGPAVTPRLLSPTKKEVLFSLNQITIVNFGEKREHDIITGSHFGGIHYFHCNSKYAIELTPKVHAAGNDENALRHPIIKPSPVAYPNAQTGMSDLIVGGEGALYYYKFSGEFTSRGNPVFEQPTPVLQQHAELYGGTLPVPNVVDWDGDGMLDIVSGNSEGRILFIKNAGSNKSPAFLAPVPILAGDREIHVQPGYRLDIQGPGEARWGYTCPTVADWNGDGLPDVLMSDATARHTIFLNRGTKQTPKLEFGHPLYLDGLDMHGTWRVKPAVAKLGNRLAYVALDDDDQFHLYWRIDDYNLQDGGKLKLQDGSLIGANFLHSGGTGRLKLNLCDWDMDGLTDMIVGTPRHGSVPNPKTGLPQSLGLPGSAILFLKNVNTNEQPLFQFPELMKFKGKPIFLGQHACGPAPARFSPQGPDLIVAEENGRFIYYARKDLSTTDN